MKMQIVIVAEYDIPDDPQELQRTYGTTDPIECAKIDQDNPYEEMLSIADRVVSYEVRPAPPASLPGEEA